MVTVPLLGAPIAYAALVLSVTTTVSSTSSKVSLIGVTAIVALADPAGIVTLPGKRHVVRPRRRRPADAEQHRERGRRAPRPRSP